LKYLTNIFNLERTERGARLEDGNSAEKRRQVRGFYPNLTSFNVP
jgi:hypothetical protein